MTLCIKDNGCGMNKEEIKRISELFPHYNLFPSELHCDTFKQEEIGDCSILFSLSKYMGVKISDNIFFDYLNSLKEKEKGITEEGKMELDNIIFDKEDNHLNGYDIIIAYINYVNSLVTF